MNLSQNKYNIITGVLSLGVAALAKAFVDNRYEAATGKNAPKNPDSDEDSFAKVVMYAAVTAAVGISVKLLMRKIMTKQWKKMGGKLPDHLS